MNVSELIEQLKQLPQDLPVVIRMDAEGNTHKPLVDVGVSQLSTQSNNPECCVLWLKYEN